MLGRTIECVLGDIFEIVSTDLPEADITNEEVIDRVISKNKPDAVIHCAAATDVEACEERVDFSFRINARGSANVAAACHRNGVRMIAISTDYVFDGDSKRPYTEFDRPTGGRNIYGQSKFAGEEMIRAICPNHCICRVSWLYGFGGPSFVHTMLKLADGTRQVIKVVNDQVGNPTSAIAVAEHMAMILSRQKLCGTFHLTCEGEASWADFAREIFLLAGREQTVEGCTTDEYPCLAQRPKNSRLDKMGLRLVGLPPMPSWKEALKTFMEKEFGYCS